MPGVQYTQLLDGTDFSRGTHNQTSLIARAVRGNREAIHMREQHGQVSLKRR